MHFVVAVKESDDLAHLIRRLILVVALIGDLVAHAESSENPLFVVSKHPVHLSSLLLDTHQSHVS